ncbi:hypothetical protein AHAS_Ahas18G0102500 [Arachis hypogaea]
MAQTPLHVAAGQNRADIVKFLLEWQRPDKVELEAKNMIAKNGCNKAAKLLLAHGAVVEAQANNGMTPLHLAVWVEKEPPSTLMWTLFLLAQHYDRRGQYKVALSKIDEAIEHTPTVIDLYSVKAMALTVVSIGVAVATMTDLQFHFFAARELDSFVSDVENNTYYVDFPGCYDALLRPSGCPLLWLELQKHTRDFWLGNSWILASVVWCFSIRDSERGSQNRCMGKPTEGKVTYCCFCTIQGRKLVSGHCFHLVTGPDRRIFLPEGLLDRSEILPYLNGEVPGEYVDSSLASPL